MARMLAPASATCKLQQIDFYRTCGCCGCNILFSFFLLACVIAYRYVVEVAEQFILNLAVKPKPRGSGIAPALSVNDGLGAADMPFDTTNDMYALTCEFPAHNSSNSQRYGQSTV